MLPLVPIDKQAGRTLELVWMLCGKETLASTRNDALEDY